MALQDFDEYDDFEKSEQVVAWLRENAVAIISGIVLGILLILGIDQWRTHQANHRAEAAVEYQQMMQAIQSDNPQAIDNAADKLKDKYKDTPFAVFAALQQADLAVKAGKPNEAEMPLKWAREHARNKSLRSLAQLRLARVDLAAGRAEDALVTLDAIPQEDYAGLVAELRGDALVTLDRRDEARKAYQDALAAFEEGAAVRNLVQMKLDDLAQPGKQDS